MANGSDRSPGQATRAAGTAPNPEPDLLAGAAALMRSVGDEGPTAVVPLTGGKNNRVYRVESESASYVLKEYFAHPEDLRDRLNAEFDFACFAWQAGVRALARPIARDQSRRIALFEFVDGRQLHREEINRDVVGHAIEFCVEINRHRSTPGARALQNASEACFSVREHIECVDRRVARLSDLPQTTESDHVAEQFVHDRLVPTWLSIRESVESQTSRCDAEVSGVCPQDRCVSPSDFGYHNAILGSDGKLRFIDFEYAGWDDPAKLVCDFFCQPELPVDMTFFGEFVESISRSVGSPSRLPERAALLLPVYRVKWCAIILNHFHRIGRDRRAFAGAQSLLETGKHEQLAKAERALAEVGN